jgi:hypothetical protein
MAASPRPNSITGLRPILSESHAKNMCKGAPMAAMTMMSSLTVAGSTLITRSRKNLRVELGRVPDSALSRQQSEQCNQHELQIGPAQKRFGERRARPRPSATIFLNIGDSCSLSLIHNEIASSNAETRNGIRQPHA